MVQDVKNFHATTRPGSDVLPAKTKRKKILFFIFEMVVLLCISIALQSWAEDYMSSLPVHPFLVITALLTVQYGTIGGGITALVATVIYLTGQTPERLIGQDYTTYNLAIWSDPISWIAATLLLGIIVDRYLQVIQSLTTDLEEKQRELDLICKHYAVITNRVKRLEKHIAGFGDDRTDLTMNTISDSPNEMIKFRNAHNSVEKSTIP